MNVRSVIPLFLLVLLAAGTPCAAQTPRDNGQQRPVAPAAAGTAVISGVVLTADEPRSPVRLARVTLNSVERGPSTGSWQADTTTTTDVNGRFVFRGLPAGRYAIQASKRAWLDANYGAARLGRPGTPVAVGSGQQLAGLTILMTRGSVIAGVVRDPSGEPQQAVQIRVMQFVTKDGVRSLERPLSIGLDASYTDDDGAYRVYGLPPGDYLVVAALRISNSSGLGGDEIRRVAPGDVEAGRAATAAPVTNAPVYFPGTTDLAAAATITLGPGEERSGVDIPFGYFPAARVTGRINVLPDPAIRPGDPAPRPPECRMTPAGFEDLMAQPIAAAVTRVDAEGRLMFPGVPPGRYTIVCVTGQGPGSGSPQILGWAETSAVVSGQDLEVAMTFGPATTLLGRVVFEGQTAPADASTQQVQIVLRPQGKARLLRDFTIGPQPDGTFKFGAMVPGGWALAVNLPRLTPWTLKSLDIGGREMADNLIEVRGADPLAELIITLTDHPSELAGALQDAAGRPATEYFVVAFSTERSAWTPSSRRIQSSRPASDGAFSIKGLPAGEYFLAALTDVEPGEWLSPAFLDQIVGASVRVRIGDGQKTVQSLRIAR